MSRTAVALVPFMLAAHATAAAQTPIILDSAVPDDAPPYFEVPFDVPAGIVEIEITHDDRSDANILDWGLRDPDGIRGWGGGNREPIVINAEAASRSYRPGPIQPGRWALIIGQALVTEAPARYHVEITLRTEATLPPQPERAPYTPAAALRTGPGWYAGDFHVHSRESGDASPTLDEIAGFARSRGLDFVELSEHNVVSQLDFIGAAQARHPEVLLLPGIEVTTYWGHANAIGATSWIDFRVMSGTGANIETMLDETAAQGAVFSINHPVLNLGDQCIGCAWNLNVPAERIQAVEVQNGAYSTTGVLFYLPATRFWDRLLDEGGHVAPIGGSDDHEAGQSTGRFSSPIGSPTTMVYAAELSASAIVRGVAEGRTVVKLEGPDDPMVELFAGDAMIGDTISDRTSELRVVVNGGAGGTLRLVRNGQAQAPISVDADPFETTLAVHAPPGTKDDRWRAELSMDGRPRVVTGHIWVRATGEPVDDAGADAGTDGPNAGCGCSAARRSSAAPFTLLVAIAWLRRSARNRHRRFGTPTTRAKHE